MPLQTALLSPPLCYRRKFLQVFLHSCYCLLKLRDFTIIPFPITLSIYPCYIFSKRFLYISLYYFYKRYRLFLRLLPLFRRRSDRFLFQ
nr:MAG TPA: hypothetical protein [Caudoviricetes sp.]